MEAHLQPLHSESITKTTILLIKLDIADNSSLDRAEGGVAHERVKEDSVVTFP